MSNKSKREAGGVSPSKRDGADKLRNKSKPKVPTIDDQIGTFSTVEPDGDDILNRAGQNSSFLRDVD